jgi:iron complex transport system ATP-binding protein
MAQGLAASAVRYSYPGGIEALKGASLDAPANAITALAGPNGSGKSTLLRVLAGMLEPDSGAVTLGGSPLGAIPASERAKRIAFLPQNVTPAFDYTAGEVVMSGRHPHLGAFGFESRRDVQIAERAMKETGTLEFSGRGFEHLSGGERQRVLIASVLAQEPEVLLLDEPTSALDIRFQVEIYGILRRLADNGLAVCVVTHDLNLASAFADTIALMSEGAVAAVGRPGIVLTKSVLENIYKTEVVVAANPATGAPTVLPAAGRLNAGDSNAANDISGKSDAAGGAR